MKKILFLIITVSLVLVACNQKEQENQSTSASPVEQPQKETVESPQQPTGDISKDASDLFQHIKELNINNNKLDEAQAIMDTYTAYYMEKGKEKEFQDSLIAVTQREALKDRAELERNKQSKK